MKTQIEEREQWHERFWSKVNVVADRNSCWLWTGATYRCGYGHFRLPGPSRITRATHIVAFCIARGLEQELYVRSFNVLHCCDNRLCVRVSHLFRGTKRDNTLDMMLKGRAVFGGIPYDPAKISTVLRHGGAQ